MTATTNSDQDSVQVVPAAPLRPEEIRTLPPDTPQAPRLFRAGFQSSLIEGSNTVTVRYSQPLGAEEVDFGYFRKQGRKVQRFRYELWPLREWKRSPGSGYGSPWLSTDPPPDGGNAGSGTRGP